MIHQYDAQTTVELPRLNASTAITVGKSTQAAAQELKNLPASIKGALVHLARETDLVQAAVFSAVEPETGQTFVVEARAEAAAWSAAHSFLISISKLTAKKKAEVAARLLDLLYADGVAFVRKPVSERWVLTEHLLAVIKNDKLDAEFAAIGGSDFLADIHAAHKALGEAAGITAAPGVTVKSGVSAALDRWKAAMRCVIAQVVAQHALALLDDAGDTASAALSARLLRAISSIEVNNPPRAAKGSGGDAGAGTGAGPSVKEKAEASAEN